MTSRIRRLLCQLLNVIRPGRSEPELEREIAAHLALMQDDFVRRGLTPDQARVAARRAFGGVEQAKELHRDARSFPWLDDARRDLRHAGRLLRRDPLFTTTAAVSLAIGIGANTTIFSIVNALLFQPPAASSSSPIVSSTSAAAGAVWGLAPALIRIISTSESAPPPSEAFTRIRDFLRR